MCGQHGQLHIQSLMCYMWSPHVCAAMHWVRHGVLQAPHAGLPCLAKHTAKAVICCPSSVNCMVKPAVHRNEIDRDWLHNFMLGGLGHNCGCTPFITGAKAKAVVACHQHCVA